jgi:hypothetical protein
METACESAKGIVFIASDNPTCMAGPAVSSVNKGRIISKGDRLDERHHPAPLRYLFLFGESSDWVWSQGPGMGIGGDPHDYAKTRPGGVDRSYRKTPVLQIGADIYCDSQLIMRELKRRHPTPSFYPAGRGAADALAWWPRRQRSAQLPASCSRRSPARCPRDFLKTEPNSPAEI